MRINAQILIVAGVAVVAVLFMTFGLNFSFDTKVGKAIAVVSDTFTGKVTNVEMNGNQVSKVTFTGTDGKTYFIKRTFTSNTALLDLLEGMAGEKVTITKVSIRDNGAVLISKDSKLSVNP